jgi:CheY-like chemotaxis protein
MAKSVLIVDDNAFLRKTLCKIFAIEEDLDVCGEAENGRDAIEKAQQLRPRLDHLGSFNARDERFGCGPCAEAFAAERTTDYVQRFR